MDVNTITPAVSASAQSVTKLTGQENNTPVSAVKPNAAPPEVTEISQEEIQVQTEDLNKLMGALQQSISFSVDSTTQSTVVNVVDKTTDELIKQIPSVDALKMLKQIQDYLEGVKQAGLSTEGVTGTLLNEMI